MKTIIAVFFAVILSATAEWVEIGETVTASVKPGWPGKTGGITCDPSSGEVFLVIPDQGIWKSSDQGKTFARADKGEIGGRCETGFALNFDPRGQRLMCFMIYGNCAGTTDGGKSWAKWKTNHLDFGAVDWEGSGKAMLGLRHEKGGMLTLSTDGGATWTDIQGGFKSLGLFDTQTLVASKGDGILRSTDSGATWTKVSEYKPSGFVVRVFKGVGYWTSDNGLLVSRDKGATWNLLGGAVNAFHGPYFGKDETHLVVVGKNGFMESTDSGKTWKQVAPLPPNYDTGMVGPNYAWDLKANIFYASSMGKPAYKFVR